MKTTISKQANAVRPLRTELPDELPPCEPCPNCAQTWLVRDLSTIDRIHERVAPGEPMPAGECPDCGFLCHLATDKPDQAAEIAKLRAALARIAKWEGEFPPTGKTWDNGTEMSYFAAFGTFGERDFMREIARAALKTNRLQPCRRQFSAHTRSGPKPTTANKGNDHAIIDSARSRYLRPVSAITLWR